MILPENPELLEICSHSGMIKYFDNKVEIRLYVKSISISGLLHIK